MILEKKFSRRSGRGSKPRPSDEEWSTALQLGYVPAQDTAYYAPLLTTVQLANSWSQIE